MSNKDDSVQSLGRLKAKVKWAAKALNENPVPKLLSIDLPWRQNRTPYRVFMAEFLLVRTRADVVAKLYEAVIRKYPDIDALASAYEVDIANTLAPLGLRKRVPFLKLAAQAIISKHQGSIPERLEDLLAIPGLGPYSAPAIMAFAFDSSTVPADVNILRFVARLTGLAMEHKSKGSSSLRKLLPLLSREYHGPTVEYLLDFTRLICKPRNPACEECPLKRRCKLYMSERKWR